LEILDREFLLRNVDRDPDLLAEIVELFFETSSQILENLRSASERSDLETLKRCAHELRGALSNLGARAAAQAASRVETLCEERAPSASLPEALASLETAVAHVRPALRTLLRTANL
jgi:HPt (histidine-containing phosphotransfer) domain-containing protein